jgi:hypothetical protein
MPDVSSQVDVTLFVTASYIGAWWVKPQALLSAEQATLMKCEGCINLLHHMEVLAGAVTETHRHYDLFRSKGYEKVKALMPTSQHWVEKVEKVETQQDADELLRKLRAEWSRKLGPAATSAPRTPPQHKAYAGRRKAKPTYNASAVPYDWYSHWN